MHRWHKSDTPKKLRVPTGARWVWQNAPPAVISLHELLSPECEEFLLFMTAESVWKVGAQWDREAVRSGYNVEKTKWTKSRLFRTCCTRLAQNDGQTGEYIHTETSTRTTVVFVTAASVVFILFISSILSDYCCTRRCVLLLLEVHICNWSSVVSTFCKMCLQMEVVFGLDINSLTAASYLTINVHSVLLYCLLKSTS